MKHDSGRRYIDRPAAWLPSYIDHDRTEGIGIHPANGAQKDAPNRTPQTKTDSETPIDSSALVSSHINLPEFSVKVI
jgi:hypothetical protein